MPSAPTVTAWLEDQLADPPAPAHVLAVMALLAAHDLELDDVQLVVNWDRHWGKREPGRWKVGTRHSGEYIWMAEKPSRTQRKSRLERWTRIADGRTGPGAGAPHQSPRQGPRPAARNAWWG